MLQLGSPSPLGVELGMILQNSSLFLILKTKSNKNLSMMTIDTIQRKLIIDDSADKENNGI